MIKDFELYHGAVLSRIVHFHNQENALRRFHEDNNASYVINKTTGIYVKFSKKRMSPWMFTFKHIHIREILEMQCDLENVFIVLVCGMDGFACLSFQELKSVLDESHEEVEWVSVSRGAREMYSVKGRDGKLTFKIGKNEFPAKIFQKSEVLAVNVQPVGS